MEIFLHEAKCLLLFVHLVMSYHALLRLDSLMDAPMQTLGRMCSCLHTVTTSLPKQTTDKNVTF